MNVDRWGPDGPPPAAYSRVTDPERFRPLHAMIETLLGELDSSFEVGRTAGYGLDEELEASALALPTVRLTPRDATAAPLVGERARAMVASVGRASIEWAPWSRRSTEGRGGGQA